MASRTPFSKTRAFHLKRAFPLIIVISVVACAYLQARTVNALLASWLLGSLVRPFVPPPASPRHAHQTAPASEIASDTFVPPPAPSLAARTDCSDVRLSIVSEFGDPEFSLASLTTNGDSRAKLRRKGDRLGDRVVTWIGTDATSREPAVWLNDDSSASACRVDLFHPPSSTGPANLSTPGSSTSSSVPSTSGSVPLRELIGPVRARPEREGGKHVGLRLFGVRPSSLLGQIGLRNGDRIDSINGYSIADPEQALIAYARLRTEEHFELRVTRGGQAVELDYRLTDSVRRELVDGGLPKRF